MLKLTAAQLEELQRAMRTASKAYVRLKATAIWNLAQGRSQREVARILDVSPMSVFTWQKRYLAEGLKGLEIRPGRGRRSSVNLEEVEQILHRTPGALGIPQTRWTLASLAKVAPSLKGFSPSGVWRVLKRARLRYKRGQPRVMSPDPDYRKKRALAHGVSRSSGTAPGGGLAL